MLEKFEKFNHTLSNWAAWIGFVAIFLMVVLTCVDVIGAKVFRQPVFGALDMMTLGQLIAVSFAAAMALIQGRMVQVEFFVPLLPKRVQAIVDSVVQLLCLGLFILIAWRLFTHGYHLQSGGEVTATAHIPVSPFTYASALAMVPVCLVILQQFLHAIRRVIKNGS